MKSATLAALSRGAIVKKPNEINGLGYAPLVNASKR